MRRRHLLLVLATLALMGLTASRAEAQEPAQEPEPPRKRTLLVEGAAGMGTPLGWLGLSAVVIPISVLALHGGVGIGSQGWQIAAGARGRIKTSETGHNFISIGGGWSMGQLAVVGGSAIPNFDYDANPIWFWDPAHILNLDASFEHDAGSVVLRPFVGLGYVLNGGDALLTNDFLRKEECPGCDPALFSRVIPYLGFAVAFGVY